jgi:hypothetical protein
MDQPLHLTKTIWGGIHVNVIPFIGTWAGLDTGAGKPALGQAVDGLIHGFLIGQNGPCTGMGSGHRRSPVEVNEESPEAQEGSGAAITVRLTLLHQLPDSFSVMIAAHDFDRQPTRGMLQRWSELTVRRSFSTCAIAIKYDAIHPSLCST